MPKRQCLLGNDRTAELAEAARRALCTCWTARGAAGRGGRCRWGRCRRRWPRPTSTATARLEVVAADTRGNVAALSADGRELWERHLKSTITQARLQSTQFANEGSCIYSTHGFQRVSALHVCIAMSPSLCCFV